MDEPVTDTGPPANHHADHPGFSGVGGLVKAVAFLFGRSRAAELAIELADLGPGQRLVDIGSGPGVAARLARGIGADVVAVDPAPVMLNVGRLRWLRSGIAWRPGSAEDLPVDDGQADVVWSLSTVHHWADLDGGLREVHRVLVPGGRLVVTERLISDPYADGVASHGWTVGQAETFAAVARRHGFVDVRTDLHDGQPRIVSATARRA